MAEPRQDRRAGLERSSRAARHLPDLAAKAADQVRSELDPLPARAARAEHLPRHASDERSIARACSLQPVLPPAGARRARAGDHVEGNRHPGHVQAEGAVRGLEAHRSLPDGDPRVRRQHVPLEASPEQGRGRQRAAARYGNALVAEPPPLLRAHAPVRGAALLPHAARRERAEHPRLVRALASQSVPAVERPRDVQGRRGDRRGQGRALRGRRLPSPAREVPQARRQDPARRPSRRPAGHREDAARTRGRRRSECPVLLDRGVRVRRGDRRRGGLPRPRPVRPGQGGRAGDRLHRRARRHRALADIRGGRLQRRQRRARADAEPDPDGNGRLRPDDERDRDRSDQSSGRARPGAAPPGPLRPARLRAASGSHGS